MSIRRSLLTPLLALAVLACAASTAHAGAMTLDVTIKGAGQVTAVSGGTFDCDERDQELETDETACAEAKYEAIFAVSIKLKTVAQSGWRRTSWEGCDDITDKNECVVTGPIANRGFKDVKATFEDVQGPEITWDLDRHNGDSTIDYAWHTDEPATFRCGPSYHYMSDCTSPVRKHVLPSGATSMDVEATDRNGSVTWSRSVVRYDVQTEITSAPNGAVSDTGATIAFGPVQGGDVSHYECSLDGGTWTACESPHKLSGLSQGNHSFEVRGYRSYTAEIVPSKVTWRVDTIAPETGVTAGPAEGAQLSSKTASFKLWTSEGTTQECRLDGGAWSACGMTKELTGLADGPHTFEARSTDYAGNTDPTPVKVSWTVDTTPSVTTIIGPNDNSTVAFRDVTFGFVAGDGATFACQLDSGAWSACTSERKYAGLADGTHVFRVRSTDDAGNVEQPKAITFTVDTTAPVAAFSDGPADGATLPAGSAPTFGFAAAGAARYECIVDQSGEWETCASPRTLSGLGAGAHSLSVRAIDAVGNVGEGVTRSFTIAAPQKPTPDPADDPTDTPDKPADPVGGSGGDKPSTGGTGGGGTGTTTGGGTAGTAGGASSTDGGTPRAIPAGTAARPRLAGRVAGVAKVDRSGGFTIPRLKAECPAGGPCTVTARVSGRLAATGSAKVAAGRSTAIRLRLTKAALKRLRAGKRTTVSVKVSVSGPGGVATQTVKVTLRR